MCAVGFGSGDKNEHARAQEVYLPLINRGLTVGVAVRGVMMVETSSVDLAMAVRVPIDSFPHHAGARLHIGRFVCWKQVRSLGFPFDFQSAGSSTTHDWPDIGEREKEFVLPTLKIRVTDP